MASQKPSSFMDGARKLGVKRRNLKPRNRSKTGICVENVVNYLKSDSFLYSHLLSSSSSSSDLFLQDEGVGGVSKKNGSEKLKEYLKSDTYMYAAFNVSRPPCSPPIIGRRLHLETISKKVVLGRISFNECLHRPKEDQGKGTSTPKDLTSNGRLSRDQTSNPASPGSSDHTALRRTSRTTSKTGSRDAVGYGKL